MTSARTYSPCLNGICGLLGVAIIACAGWVGHALAQDVMVPLNQVPTESLANGTSSNRSNFSEYPYKPDAIPLSQYQTDWQGVDGVPGMTDSDNNSTRRQKEYYLAIYSGSTTGVYFQVAGKVCELMRQTYEQHHIRCVPLRSRGVASNVELMKEGRVQVAIVQSNTNWDAAQGISPIPGARSVMSLHDEMGLLVVRPDSGIRSVADLRGKRINVGPEGSASRALWTELLSSYDITAQDLRTIYGVAQDYNQIGICDDFIDAYGLWIGHPATPILDTISACKARVVGMGGPGTDQLIDKNSYFFHQALPANTYPGQNEPVESYGFKASVIAYAPANPYVIYWLSRVVHENIAELRTMHPAFHSLTASDLKEKGNFLPFHDGAACYWQAGDNACTWQQNFAEEIPQPRRNYSN
ncbi:TAXI family TRAP transporter solute-binding subunit [Thalassospira sp.]|uniref:TAXI family TRAP transporter solute-binding subunit n=1 Tax=Thalassospira sp. TaxID=1912094 RepID=UPI0027363717|nr:TAXI family TRAP transporter solute-binding subunit [Thalassospira sp.]MDP2699982.1 TAXI family TRAP transporter solute-binding subunit [Thalassospira sp.]